MAALSLAVFLLMKAIPGDPVLNLMGERVSQEALATRRAELGLDKALPVQFVKYAGRLAHGDLGQSMRMSGESVGALLMARLPYTLALAGGAMLVSILIGVGLGVLAGSRPGSWVDTFAMFFGLLGISTPVFWLAMFLVFVFSLKTNLVPVGGAGDGSLGEFLPHLLLPVLTLGLRSGALLSRYVRMQWIEARASLFALTAKARGVAGFGLIWRHMARPNLGPVLQVVGLDFASYLTGSVVTETVFTWPGLGSLMMRAISDRDLPVLTGVILLSALIYGVVLLVVDMLHMTADPRLRGKAA